MTTSEIRTYADIRMRLAQLEQGEPDQTIDVLETIDNSIALSAALTDTWEYAGPGAANYTMRAMEAAGQNDGLTTPPIPDSDRKAPAEIESDLISAYETWCSDVYDTFRRLNAILQGRLQRLKAAIGQMNDARVRDFNDTGTNFYAAEIDANSPSDANIHNVRDTLGGPLDAFLDKRNLFQTFRTAHGLRRNPKYEASMLAFLFIAIICVVVETAVNGFMYGQASELGLIGGWGVAAGLSIVIFSSSFVAGWILTFKNALRQSTPPHPEDADGSSKPDGNSQSEGEAPSRRRSQPTWKRSFIPTLTGWGGWIALSALILVLIAFVCVYRDEAATFEPSAGTHPMAEAINRLTTLDLLPQADIEGLLLIFVNLAIMVIAMYKGYTHFDTVPDYKAHAEELARARQQFKDTLDQAQHDLRIADTNFGDKLRRYTEADLDNLVHRYADGVAALKQLQVSHDIQVENTARECNERLNAYRNANEIARPNDIYPAPAYFKEPWQPPIRPPLDHRTETLDDVDTGAIADALEQHRAAALEELNRQATRIYSDEISRYVQESEKYHFEVNQKEA